MTLVNYYEIFLFLLASVDMEDNVKEDSIGVIAGWMFMLATFCDEAKKRHKLEHILTNVSMMGLFGEL